MLKIKLAVNRGLWYACGPLILALGLLLTLPAGAEPPGDMGGWESGSPYNQNYRPAEREQFKATVVDVKTVVPLKGMSPGIAVLVRESKNEAPIEVQLCPQWFAKINDIGLKKGDRVKVYGSWAYIDGKDIFMGAKIKKGDHFEFKTRLTSDGTPFWTMSEEQLAKERGGS